MRQIKFRVWNKKTKAWIYGPHKHSDLDGVNLIGETILFGEFLRGVSIEDLNEIVTLQFTGLYDKNGKEIFEGDIVKIEQTYFGAVSVTKDDLPVFFLGEVFYNEETASFRANISDNGQYCFQGGKTLEVVGNIFEQTKAA